MVARDKITDNRKIERFPTVKNGLTLSWYMWSLCHFFTTCKNSQFASFWAATSETMPSDMCVRRRIKSVCTATQSDQRLCCPHEEKVAYLAGQNVPNNYANQTVWMIWIFAGRIWFWRFGSFYSIPDNPDTGSSASKSSSRAPGLSARSVIVVIAIILTLTNMLETH